MAARRRACHLGLVYFASESGWTVGDAERAFDRAVRSRRRASLWQWLIRGCVCARRLRVLEPRTVPAGAAVPGIREIPLEAIVATVEPNRAEQFDAEFRPARHTRERWVRVWIGETAGTGLPPISVTPVADGYAVRDGHHRVSVARARGAATIPAIVA